MQAHLAGMSLTFMSQLFNVLKTIVFTIMTVYTKHGKTSAVKKNSGQKPKVNDRDCQTLRRRTVYKQHRTIAAKVTASLNIHPKNPVSTKKLNTKSFKTSMKELHLLQL